MEVQWHGTSSCCNIIRSCIVFNSGRFSWWVLVNNDHHWQFHSVSATDGKRFLCGPTNAKHCLFWAVWPCRRCWCFARWKRSILALGILKMYTFLIASKKSMERTLSFTKQKQNFPNGSSLLHPSLSQLQLIRVLGGHRSSLLSSIQDFIVTFDDKLRFDVHCLNGNSCASKMSGYSSSKYNSLQFC